MSNLRTAVTIGAALAAATVNAYLFWAGDISAPNAFGDVGFVWVVLGLWYGRKWGMLERTARLTTSQLYRTFERTPPTLTWLESALRFGGAAMFFGLAITALAP